MSSHDLVARWIEPDSVKSGPEEARVKGYGVHVWALLNLLTTDHLDRPAAARADALPDEAIDAVLANYQLHKERWKEIARKAAHAVEISEQIGLRLSGRIQNCRSNPAADADRKGEDWRNEKQSGHGILTADTAGKLRRRCHRGCDRYAVIASLATEDKVVLWAWAFA